MGENFLKLNPSKTEVLVLTNKADKSPIPETLSLDPDEEDFKVAETARNLGIWFDSKLSMSEHISRTVRACWAQLSNLWRIGSRLTRQTKIQLVHTLIHSRLDYGNALLKQATKEDINRLQKVQNSAVRFINNHKRRRGVTKLRRELHFLPVNARIDFKILLLTYKCINGLAPSYLRDLITPRKQTGHNLRKDNDPTLLEKTFSSKYRHTRAAFSLNAPKLWNGLPRGIRESSTVEMFKTRLKTHLFRLAYEWTIVFELISCVCNVSFLPHDVRLFLNWVVKLWHELSTSWRVTSNVYLQCCILNVSCFWVETETLFLEILSLICYGVVSVSLVCGVCWSSDCNSVSLVFCRLLSMGWERVSVSIGLYS